MDDGSGGELKTFAFGGFNDRIFDPVLPTILWGFFI